MQEYLVRMTAARQKIDELAKKIDLPRLQDERLLLEKEAEAPNLWNDREKAQSLLKRLNDIRSEIDEWESLIKRARDTVELLEMNDESLLGELEPEIGAIEAAAREKEISVLFSGKYDRGNAILAIHAGAGGTEAHDWAAMLQRMYLRWAENHRFTTEIVDFTPGEEAGTKTITISVAGRFAYGFLKSEKGTHRLVRLSPFDAAHRRVNQDRKSVV